MSVGSAPLITPVAKPIAKPPSVAVQSRSIPPTTTPTSTTIVSLSAKSGETSGFWTVRITATVAARTPGEQDGDADDAVGLDAEQPRGAEVGRGGAHLQADRRPPEQEREQRQRDDRDDDGEDRHLADVDAADRHHLVQRRDRDGRLADRAVADVEDQRDRLEQERDREGGHEHHRRRLRPQRPEDGALHQERERDHDREAGERCCRRPASPT